VSPVTFLALALIAGVAFASVLPIPLWLSGPLLAGALAVAIAGRRSRFAVAALIVIYFLLGAALYELQPPPERFSGPRSDRETAAYRSIAKQAKLALGERKSGLALAVVFGDQTGVSAADKDNFRRAGLWHLFVASGFHVTLAAGSIMWLGRLLGAPKLPAAALGLATIGFYFWLVGPSPSIVRATVMSTILYLAMFFGRRVDSPASLSVAAIIMLALDPRALFSISWQLSFASLLGILIIAPRIADRIEPGISRVVSPLVITAGAQVAVAPFLLYYFGQLSIIALLANPIVATVVVYVTGVGFTAGALSLVWPWGGRTLFSVLAVPLAFVDRASAFFASLPAAALQWTPSLTTSLMFVTVVAAAFAAGKQRLRTITLPLIIIFIVGLQAFGIWFDLAAGVQREALVVSFMDVGQGDATLIKTKKGTVVLIDGGKDYRLLDRGLRRRGVKRVDLLVLSHAHADHVGALDELIEKYPVGLIVEPGFDHPTPDYRDFKEAAARNEIPVKRPRAGHTLEVEDISLDILWPRKKLLMGTDSDVNNNSLVAKLRYENFNLLLTGDIQNEAIDELVRRRAPLKAQVLKVSHQGALNGTTVAFLRRVKPDYAVISVGEGNLYGHPHAKTLRRLNRATPRVRRTDLHGDVTVVTDGYRIRFK
jgi:competence protein ComEC